ncbi:MAG: TIGR03663 family protein [Candidatus Altiarchaeota archaeon]
MEFSERTEKILFFTILFIGAFLRIYQLDLRPAHFDEGGGYAHGILNILRGGIYDYNPDFHGPFLFHITALIFFLFGINDITLRITEAIFGVFSIFLMYPIRKEFSRVSFLAVSAFLAISPSLVYFSRFALHDSYFIFFTFATIVSFLLFIRKKKKIYAYSTAASLSFLFTVKESAYITFAIFFSYLLLEFLYLLIKNKRKANNKILEISKKKNLETIFSCIIIFIFIFTLLFTSFFRNFNNLEVAIKKPITNWIHRIETGQGYYKPLTFYFEILMQFELPILIFGVLGIFLTIFTRKPVHRFFAYFALTSIAIYHYIPYKMSNMVVNISFPLILTSGIFFDFLSEKIDKFRKKAKIYFFIITYLVLLLSSIYILQNSIITNFVNYNNEPENKMVFVQTVDDIKQLLKEIERISERAPQGKMIEIDISIPQTEYPLSWYLRDYKNVRFYNEKVNVPENWLGFNWEGDAVISWTSSEKKSGSKSMKISSLTGANANFWQRVPVDGGKYYEFSGWIKTNNISKVGEVEKVAQIHIRSDKGEAPPGFIIKENYPLLGTNNWTEVKFEFFLPEDENAVWISCVLANWGKAKGEIFFDDLVLREKGKTENLIPNGDFEIGNKIERFNAPIIILSENDGQVLESREGYVMKKYLLRPTVNLAVYFRNDIYY